MIRVGSYSTPILANANVRMYVPSSPVSQISRQLTNPFLFQNVCCPTGVSCRYWYVRL